MCAKAYNSIGFGLRFSLLLGLLLRFGLLGVASGVSGVRIGLTRMKVLAFVALVALPS